VRRVAAPFLLLLFPVVQLSACSSTESTPSDEPLRADFSFDISYDETYVTYCPVQAIQFTDLSTGFPTAWLWEFPDGESSTEQNPTVAHSLLGDVTLTVTRDGGSDQVVREVVPAMC
jgi:PKD repeat protein